MKTAASIRAKIHSMTYNLKILLCVVTFSFNTATTASFSILSSSPNLRILGTKRRFSYCEDSTICPTTTQSTVPHFKYSTGVVSASTNSDNNYYDNEEDDYNDDDDDDDDSTVQPYGNRSLQWTQRYRKLIPYEEARRRVLKFGHRSKEDWDECVMNGWQGQYVPARPDEMYATEWVSWEEFLGIMRTYEEAQQLVTQVLKIQSMDEYHIFVQ